MGYAAVIAQAYGQVTGRPYWTGRSMAAEFGPPPAIVFREELAGLSDVDLLRGPQRCSPGRLLAPAGKALS